MPNKLKIILITIFLLVSAGFGYLLINKDSSEVELNSPTTQNQPQPEQKRVQNQEVGQYLEYSEDLINKTVTQRILFFHAPWCPQCRQLDENIKSETIPSGVTIFKVDYDSNQKLRQQYGVTIQTTLVLLAEDDSEVKKFIAYDQPNLDAVIENLL